MLIVSEILGDTFLVARRSPPISELQKKEQRQLMHTDKLVGMRGQICLSAVAPMRQNTWLDAKFYKRETSY